MTKEKTAILGLCVAIERRALLDLRDALRSGWASEARRIARHLAEDTFGVFGGEANAARVVVRVARRVAREARV